MPPPQPLAMETNKPDDDEEETGWKLRFSQATTVIGAIVGLVLLIMSIIAYAQMAGFVSDYENVANSWTTLPVSDIVFHPKATGCGVAEAVSSYWPGLYDACDCSTRRSGTNSTSSDDSSCSQKQTDDGCTERPSQWGKIALEPIANYSMCLGRTTPTALQRTQDASACSSSEQVCGASMIPFCWPSNDRCPVTDFIITTSNYSQTDADADQKYEIGSSGTYVYIKRGGRLSATVWPDSVRNIGSGGAFAPTGLPLIDIVMQPGTPCTLSGCGYGGRSSEYAGMESAYAAANPSFGYKLKPFPCDGGCKSPDVSGSVSPAGLDLRYDTTLWSMNERALYQRAGVPAEYWPSVSTAYLWQVQQRSEVRWSTTCPETRAKVVDRKSDVQSVKNAQTALLVFGILSFILLTLYFPCIMAFGAPETKKKSKNANKYCNIFIKAATLACTIATVVIAYATLSFWSSVNDAGGCADPLSNETFKVLGDKFGELSYKNAISTAASSGTAVADIAFAACKRFM